MIFPAQRSGGLTLWVSARWLSLLAADALTSALHFRCSAATFAAPKNRQHARPSSSCDKLAGAGEAEAAIATETEQATGPGTVTKLMVEKLQVPDKRKKDSAFKGRASLHG